MSKNTNLRKITNYLTADNNTLSSNVSQTITGSLTVTGNLTAQQFILSSSVTYLTESFASGSHKFGDSSDDNHNFTGSLIVSGSANPLRVGSNLLFVSSSGNVIIGDTADYSVRTHIAGTGATTSTGTGSSNIVMLLRDTTTGGINVGAGIGFAGNDGTNTGVTFATINGRKENSTTGNFASYLQFMTRADGGSLTERMRITSTGAATFFSGVTANNFVASGGNNTTVFNSGGATTGWAQIAMNNTNGSSLLGVEGSTAGTLCTGTLAYSSVLRNYTATDLHIGTNNIVRATFTSAGNVGIANTSPSFKLEVNNNGAEEAGISINSTFADGYRATLRLKNTHTGGKTWDLYSTNTADGVFGAGKFAIRNASDSVNALTITSTGQVTIPNQPAWSVGLSAQQNFSSTPGTIVWNQSSGNECFVQGGVSLNSGNGRITVPVAGKYVVFASIRTEATGAAFGTNLNLRKNGTTLQRHYVGGAVNSAGSFMYIETRPIIVNCAANDYIDLHFDSVTNDFVLSAVSNTVVRFGGYLVG
jgi:hypothetical protein